MSGLPIGWTKARFGELGDVRLGKMLDKARNRGVAVRYLRNVNVRWFGFDLSDLQTLLVPEEEKDSFSVRDGDLLICEGGEPGRSAVWRAGRSELIFQKALHRMRTAHGMVPEFLMYQLCADAESGRLRDLFTGTTIKHLTGQSLDRYEVALAPASEQVRIVRKVSSLFDRLAACRARLDRIPQLLKRFRDAVLDAAVSGKLTEEWRSANNAERWESTTIGGVCSESFYGPRFGKEEYTSSGVPTIRTTDMTAEGRIIITEDTPRVAVSKERLNQFRVRRGDLLVTRTGSIGVMAVFEDEYDAIPSAYLIRFRFAERVLPRYAFHTLMSPRGQDALGLSARAITQPNVNAEAVKRIPIDLPSIQEQAEIVRRVDELLAMADALARRHEAVMTHVKQLPAALLAKAFRGELVPQDPNDEPAEKLLERIRCDCEAERKAAQRRGTPVPA